MPFTFAHPAAVLPLRRLCPRFLNLKALIIGSMMPDCGYYMHVWQWSMIGHSFLGCLTFDLPAGLIALCLFYAGIRPVTHLLPSPHKEALLAICQPAKIPSATAVVRAGISIMLGAWTHIVWDGFTHDNGWCVRKFAAITPPLFEIGSYKVSVWHLLQHGSTIFGLAILIAVYLKYARSYASTKDRSDSSNKPPILLASLVTIPALVAITLSLPNFRKGIDLPHFAAFTFDAIVNYVCILLPLLFFAGITASIIKRLKRMDFFLPKEIHSQEIAQNLNAKQLVPILPPSAEMTTQTTPSPQTAMDSISLGRAESITPARQL